MVIKSVIARLRARCVVCFSAVLLFAVLIVSPASHADLAIGGRLGSMGIGIDIAKQLNRYFNLRIAFSGYQFEYESTENDIEYQFELDVGATGLLIDWHPFKGGMRVTSGIYSNSTKLTGLATPTTNYGIGGSSYSPDDIGSLTAEMGLGSTAPYIGMGWGYDLNNAGLGLALDIGILVQSSPEVAITVSNIDSLPSTIDADVLQADLDAEAEELSASLDNFELYPVAMIGLSYVF